MVELENVKEIILAPDTLKTKFEQIRITKSGIIEEKWNKKLSSSETIPVGEMQEVTLVVEWWTFARLKTYYEEVKLINATGTYRYTDFDGIGLQPMLLVIAKKVGKNWVQRFDSYSKFKALKFTLIEKSENNIELRAKSYQKLEDTKGGVRLPYLEQLIFTSAEKEKGSWYTFSEQKDAVMMSQKTNHKGPYLDLGGYGNKIKSQKEYEEYIQCPQVVEIINQYKNNLLALTQIIRHIESFIINYWKIPFKIEPSGGQNNWNSLFGEVLNEFKSGIR